MNRLSRRGIADRIGRRQSGWKGTLKTLEDRVVPATITVTSLDDSGTGTLRAAIEQADLDTGQDTIDFAPLLAGTIRLSNALPDLSGNLIIDGPGASVLTVARSGDAGTPAFRVFTVPEGATVQISGLTVSGGEGAVATYGTLTRTVGGGISNSGTLTVTDSVISGNSAADFGGGISNLGTMTVTGSTISDDAAGVGGGIENGGSLTLTNCTFSGNSAQIGGAIDNGIITSYTLSPVLFQLVVTNGTISGNQASTAGGISTIGSAVGQMKNTLISGNTNGEFISPSGFSMSHNLITDTADPLLGPLADNGGPTPTMALLPGSPAIGTGIPIDGVTTDQRGIARPQGQAPDIGAFESRGFTVAVASGSDQNTPSGAAFGQVLTVRVTSPFGEPVAGGQVTFDAPTIGASAELSTRDVTIGADGLAQVAATANGIGGSYAVVAHTAGASDVSFALTNDGPPAVTGVVTVGHSGAGLTRITLGFSEGMVRRSATKAHFFRVVASVRTHHKVVSRRVRIREVSYHDASNRVTIRLASPLRGAAQITVLDGLLATNGLSSNGTFTALVE